MADGDVTSEGKRLIDQWVRSRDHVAQLKRQLNSAECDMMNNHNALAKWLLPDDAKPGEKIAVWHGDNLVQVEVAGGLHGDHLVTVRTRGKRGLAA